jgi:hypothetical protein
VGTLRPEATPTAHPLATLGRRLERDGLARRLPLPPLSARACRDPRAEGILTTACVTLQEQAASISDENLRRSFLENRPDHRELIAEWKATNNVGMTQQLGVGLFV